MRKAGMTLWTLGSVRIRLVYDDRDALQCLRLFDDTIKRRRSINAEHTGRRTDRYFTFSWRQLYVEYCDEVGRIGDDLCIVVNGLCFFFRFNYLL